MVDFLNDNLAETNSHGYVPPPALVLPVTVKNGDKYLGVDMSLGDTGEWAEVDFTNSDFDGIYTDGLTSCCALTIIKKDTDGNIEKAWMLHLAGGFNVEQMKSLPEPWDNEYYEMIGKFGNSHQREDMHEDKIDNTVNKILDRYSSTGLNRDDIKIFASNNDSGSMAINRDGYVGLKPNSLPGVNIRGKRTVYYSALDNHLQYISSYDYEREKRNFETLIEISPQNQKIKLVNIYNRITDNSNQNFEGKTKALIYTRQYLCSSKTDQHQKEYRLEMDSIGPSWLDIAKLVIATICVVPIVFYTIPKTYTFFQQNSCRNEIVNNLTETDLTAPLISAN